MNRTEEILKFSKKIEEQLKYNNENMTVTEFLSEVKKISFENKYALWVINQYINGSICVEDFGRLQNSINIFHKHKDKLPAEKRNIMDFSKFSDFENVAEDLSFFEKQNNYTKEQKEKIYSETEFVYEGPEGKILIPKTKESSIFWGQGTRWCTASENYNPFNTYNKQSPLYILILPEKDELGREVKYQFHLETEQFMDMADKSAWKTIFDKKYFNILRFLFDAAMQKFENENFLITYCIRSETFSLSSKKIKFNNGESFDILDIALNKIKFDENMIYFLTKEGLLDTIFIKNFLSNTEGKIDEKKFINILFKNNKYFSHIETFLYKKTYWNKFLKISETNSDIYGKLKEMFLSNYSKIFCNFTENNQSDYFQFLKNKFVLNKNDYEKIYDNIEQNKSFYLQSQKLIEKTKIFDLLKKEKEIIGGMIENNQNTAISLFSSSILTPEKEKQLVKNIDNVDFSELIKENSTKIFHIFSKMLINGSISHDKYIEICDSVLTTENYIDFKNTMDNFAKNYPNPKLNTVFNFENIDKINSITKAFFYFYCFKNKKFEHKKISNYENFEQYLLDLKKAGVSQNFENIFYDISHEFFIQEKYSGKISTNFSTFITEKFFNRNMNDDELRNGCNDLFNYLNENHLQCSFDNIWKNTHHYNYNFHTKEIMQEIYEISLDDFLYQYINYNEEPRNAFDLEHVNNQELMDFMEDSVISVNLYYRDIKDQYSYDIKTNEHKSRTEEFLLYFALRINEQKDESTLKTIIENEANKQKKHRKFGFEDKKVFVSWLENCIDYNSFDPNIFIPMLDNLLNDEENKFIVLFSPIFKNRECVNYLKNIDKAELGEYIEKTMIKSNNETCSANKTASVN